LEGGPLSSGQCGTTVHAVALSLSKRTLWIGTAAIAGVALTVFAVSRSHHDTKAHAIARDVPVLEGGAISFSDAFKTRAGLEFGTVEKQPFKPAVSVVGTVAFNPTYVAAIGTRLRGFVRQTHKQEGDTVKPGDALAEVESAELGSAQTSILEAKARLDAAELNVKRERELLANQLTTAREAEIAEADLSSQRATLQAAQQRTKVFGGDHQGQLGVFVMRSPIAGQVVERHVVPGQSVDGDFIGYKVANLDHLWIELSVFERDLAFVMRGDPVEVNPVAAPKVRLPAVVAHVGEIIEEATRSTQVRVAIDQPSVHLRPGQSVHATIISNRATEDALQIPRDAVVFVDGNATVFVADTDTRVRPVTVKLGSSNRERYEVLSGVEAGQRIAIAGVFALKSELYR